MNSGPKLNPQHADSLFSFHDQILIQGQEESVKSFNSKSTHIMLNNLTMAPLPDFDNNRISDKMVKSTDSKKCSEKKKKNNAFSFLREIKKVKLVKQAVEKLTANLTQKEKLKKINYQIIGDSVTETKASNWFDGKYLVRNSKIT